MASREAVGAVAPDALGAGPRGGLRRGGTRAQARAAVEHGRAVILTDPVVNTTQWGGELAGRPGVYVAGSTPAVVSIVESVVAEDIRIDIAFPPSGVMISCQTPRDRLQR
jgi:hypothetical protein